MCLATNCIIPFVALRDIPVYKILYTDNRSPYRISSYEPYTGYSEDKFSYELFPRQVYKKPSLRLMGVNRGLHAFRSLKAAIANLSWGLKIVEMTVPKGAIYFIGVNGEIVSNKLVTGNLEPIS